MTTGTAFRGQTTPQDHRRQKEYCNCFELAFEFHPPPHPKFQCWKEYVRGCGVSVFLFSGPRRQPENTFPTLKFGVRGRWDSHANSKRLQYSFCLQSGVSGFVKNHTGLTNQKSSNEVHPQLWKMTAAIYWWPACLGSSLFWHLFETGCTMSAGS